MTASTKSRLTSSRGTDRIALVVAAGAATLQGCMVGIDAAGAAVNGAITASRIVGVADADAAPGEGVHAQRGADQAFAFGNSAGGDLITKAHIGLDCYLVDNQTVALTSDTNARPRAGSILDVDAYGVWVVFD